MSLGLSPRQSDLFATSTSFCESRVAPGSIYGLLHRQCFELFPDELFADLFTEDGVYHGTDRATGEAKWEFKMFQPSWGGTMSTSGGLIFAGDEDGYFMAFDARTGKNVWRINTGNRIATAPVTYMVDNRQYVTIASGAALITFALPQ